ncbi:MAG: PaaI family thioesterase [Angelakisella sp.]
MDYIEEARKALKNDVFAQEVTGIVIDEAEPGYAKCSFVIEEKHMNSGHMVMGGAIFTLADFAFGAVANLDHNPTVTLSSSISFLSPPKGTRVIAEARCVKSGRSTCVVDVRVFDDIGTSVAISTMTGFRKSK